MRMKKRDRGGTPEKPMRERKCGRDERSESR